MYIHTCVCMCMCIYIYIYTYIHTYIHTLPKTRALDHSGPRDAASRRKRTVLKVQLIHCHPFCCHPSPASPSLLCPRPGSSCSHGTHPSHELPRSQEMFTLLDSCVSSLRRGHADIICIVPSLTDDPRRESDELSRSYVRLIEAIVSFSNAPIRPCKMGCDRVQHATE